MSCVPHVVNNYEAVPISEDLRNLRCCVFFIGKPRALTPKGGI